MLATLLAALDQTIVATALPQIADDLHGFEDLSWVVTAYLLATTVTVPLYGKLSDLYGRRRLFVVSHLDLPGRLRAVRDARRAMGELIAFRALQGIGAGGLIPLSQAAIADLFSPRERGRYQGYIGSMWATAAVAGPLLGGTLTDAASWRWIFLINLPLGAIALVVVVQDDAHAGTRTREHTIDYGGAVALSVGVTCVLLACAWGGTTYAWDSPQVIAAAVDRRRRRSLAFVVHRAPRAGAAAAARPLPHRARSRSRPRPRCCIGGVLFGITIYVPVYMQGVLGARRRAPASC